MFMLNSNEPINVTHFQKLANQSILTGILVIEMVNNSFSDSKKRLWSFDKTRNVLIERNRDMSSEKYISTILG